MQQLFANNRNGRVNEVTSFCVDTARETPKRSASADDVALFDFAQIDFGQFRDRPDLLKRACGSLARENAQ